MHPIPVNTAAPRRAGSVTDLSWMAIVCVGVVAAMHIWKLPSALASIDSELGLGLVRAGVLLGIIQVASMLGGLAVAWFGEQLGLRRMLAAGLVLLAAGSCAGAFATGVPLLMASRAVEGVGFLLCTVLAPALIRECCPPSRLNAAMAGWGAFQGTAALLGFAVSALLLEAVSWRVLWLAMAVFALAMLVPLLKLVPAEEAKPGGQGVESAGRLVLATVRSGGPWIAGLVFACYTIQWMAVMGFLPSIYQAVGASSLAAGLLSALVGGVNVLGALGSGVLMQRGSNPNAMLVVCFSVMALSSVGVFAFDWGAGAGLIVQLAFAVLFSMVGGAAPAILSRIAVDLAPSGGSVAAVIGLMQQIFNVGNFFGPFLIAWVALAVGGWHGSWWLTGAFSALGIALTGVLARQLARSKGPHAA